MFPSEKIEAWIQEVAARPQSAPLIIQFIANRLNELSKWNEDLRAENIALRTGERVKEYEQQITHLEYQLELLKRQFGGELPDAETMRKISPPAETLSLLIYDNLGRILRLELNPASLAGGATPWNLSGLPSKEEPARLLVVPSSEELLCIFNTGRITPLRVTSLLVADAETIEWDAIPSALELGVNEWVACLVPVSKMALADFFLQVSRRGFMKKIRMALVPSIMENNYIGTGVKLPNDETLDILLGNEGDQYVLISQEGYLQMVTEQMLSYAVEEATRLNPTDHLMAAVTLKAGQSIFVMTQLGKGLHRTADALEVAPALNRTGKALYSKARRESGVRVVGGGAVNGDEWGVALHQNGGITLHAMSELFSNSAIPTGGEILAFAAFSAPGIHPKQ